MDEKLAQPTGFVAGSKALDTLDRLITSTESFFHPSNSGPYTISVGFLKILLCTVLTAAVQLTSFLQYLAAFFCQRMREEEQASCRTPIVCTNLSKRAVY